MWDRPATKIAAVAVTLFVLLLAAAPRLAAGRSSAADAPAAAAAAPNAQPVSTPSPETGRADVIASTDARVPSAAPVTPVPRAAPDSLDSIYEAPELGSGRIYGSDPAAAGDGATESTIPTETIQTSNGLSLALAPVLDDKESLVLGDLDEVTWKLRVTNESGEKLWAVFAWVELTGQATCDDRTLEAGESTDCYVAGRLYSGEWAVEAWATAWTTEAMVEGTVIVPIVVGD